MTAPAEHTDLHAAIAALRTERDAALAREATLAEALATRNSEYGERIEQQAATIDVLKAMSASPGDPQPVFDLIVERARSFCGADHATAALLQDDMLHLQAHSGMSAAYDADYVAQFPRQVDTSTMFGRAILSRDVMQTGNLRAERDHFARQMHTVDFHSIVAVPIFREGTPIGAIALGQNASGGFTDTQIELLKTFAEQAVIAISSAETYRNLHEALEQQTATTEVLEVINTSPGNLTPVFDAMLEKATRLCGAAFGMLRSFDGEQMHTLATRGVPPAFAEYSARNALTPMLTTGPARALETGRPAQTMDITEGVGYQSGEPGARALADLGGARTILHIPLFKDRTPVGLFSFYRQEVRAFTDNQIALLENFAAQAVIAMENARLMTEQQEALEQQTATAEVLQVINANPGDLTPVFDAILDKAHTLCGAVIGSLVLFDGTYFRAVATHGWPDSITALFSEPTRPNRARQSLVDGERFVQVPDIRAIGRGPNSAWGDAVVESTDARTMLLVPLRKDGALLGFISAFRPEVRAFSDKEISLLENFAAQAVIAMENARLINEQREALEQQTATTEVLQVINSSPGDLAPVFDAMLEKAHGLCGIAMGSLELYDGQRFRAVAVRGLSDAFANMLRQGYPASENPATRPLIDGGRLTHIRDLAETDYAITRSGAELDAARTLLCVPLRREGTLLGMIASSRKEVRPFSDKEIALLENFAAQAVIAMENARLLTEQREALEQQTATTQVLQIINSSPGNLTPVFDAMLEKAMRLCEAPFGSLYTYDGESFRSAAQRGVPLAYAEFRARNPPTLVPGSGMETLVTMKRTFHVLDVKAGNHYRTGEPGARAMVDLGGIRTLLSVRLVKDDALVGIFSIYRQEVRAFSDRQIELLENFAAQAVIAMENARLLIEQQEALDQQTATAEVLQVINASPGNLAPVFDAMLEKAIRLCEAEFGTLRTWDGERFHLGAAHGDPRLIEWTRRHGPFTPDGDAPLARIVRGEEVVRITDDQLAAYQTSSGFGAMAAAIGSRSGITLALRKDTTLLGTITVYRKNEVRPFTDKQVALLQNFAAQAVIAMENARLLEEIRQRQAELRVTFDNMGDGVVMFDAEHRLAAWNRNFQQLLAVPDAMLAERPSYADYLSLLAEQGEFGTDDVEAELARRLGDTDRELRLERTRPDGRVIEVRRNAVPGGGFVLIYSDITERKRSEEEIRAARDAAETALRELKIAQANLIQAEKMASLGQLTAGIAHEIKNPLNFVNNFAALSVDLLSELKETAAPGFAALTEKQRAEVEEVSAMLTSNLEKITEHGRRADGIVKAMLEHSRGSSGERRVVDLNALIDEALNLAYHGARAQDQSFNIMLERDFGEGISPIEVNPQDMTRVLLNIFSNGFYAVTKRARDGEDAVFVPTLKVTTRDTGDAVEIRVRDNGTGIPADIRDKIFQPFYSTKPTGEGTGLGLSITYDIVTQQHGGTITVDSDDGEYSEFAIRLPRNP